MDSQEALTLAIEQVNKLSTNTRGYQDGITLPQKIDAVERLAAVLMGEAAAVEGGGDPDLVVDLGEYWIIPGNGSEQVWRCNLCGAIVEYDGVHTAWHKGLGR